MGFIDLISNALGVLKGWLGFAQQKDSEKNAAPVVAGKVRAQDQAATDAVNQTIKKGDINAIRNDLAE